jgi:hypothetical protein
MSCCFSPNLKQRIKLAKSIIAEYNQFYTINGKPPNQLSLQESYEILKLLELINCHYQPIGIEVGENLYL